MTKHSDIDDATLRLFLKSGNITCAGNSALKIYGTLHCSSGKRMNRKNRVFFISAEEAIANGFRPCGHCMKMKYLSWKQAIVDTKNVITL